MMARARLHFLFRGGNKEDVHSPHSHAVLGVAEALDGAEDMRERVLGVPAHQREQHARSQQGRLGAPALLREIPRPGPEYQQRRGGGQQQRDPGHGDTGTGSLLSVS